MKEMSVREFVPQVKPDWPDMTHDLWLPVMLLSDWLKVVLSVKQF